VCERVYVCVCERRVMYVCVCVLCLCVCVNLCIMDINLFQRMCNQKYILFCYDFFPICIKTNVSILLIACLCTKKSLAVA